MKILIAYHSKNGTSEKCARLLLKQVGDADLADLKKKTPDFESYDLIVIGGSIRMGMYTRPVRKALKKYEEVLQQKKVIYFINCAFPETGKNIIRTIFLKSSGSVCWAVLTLAVRWILRG